jgi:hypothetical protein
MAALRRIVAGLTAAGCLLAAAPRAAPQAAPSGAEIAVPMTPDRWTFVRTHPTDSTHDGWRFETHLGRSSLFVPEGFAFASGIALRDGSIEADVATYPEGHFLGLAFHVASEDQYEIIFFRPHNSDGTVQYTPSFFHMNAWQFFPPPDYVASPDFPQDRWVHVRIVMRGLVASFYLDTASTPTLEIHDLALGSHAGTIGFWGRGGGGYISNLRYRPDTASYSRTPEHGFAQGAITEGWSLSDAFPADNTDPDVYPNVRGLHWQSVQAEREGIVLIGRYRWDPNVEPARPLSDGPSKPSPGTEVVFARTTIASDHDQVRKMWIGYSDDVVVYLNGRPLYAGRNAISYRDPGDLGYVYPYADAVFLPLKKGKNELLLAVSESTAGWGFLCRLDPK